MSCSAIVADRRSTIFNGNQGPVDVLEHGVVCQADDET